MTKVMLAYPNLRWTEIRERTAWDMHPYNLGVLASMIRNRHEVVIVDANGYNFSKEDFAEKIKDEKPDILGISVLTNEYAKAGYEGGGIAKEINPEISVVIGGVHATTSELEKLFANDCIDFVIKGEGEYAFKELCDYLDSDGSERKIRFPEKGVSFRHDGKVVDRGRTEFIQDLNALPYPAYDLFEFMKYANRIQREDVGRAREFPYARMMTSRGCPYNCCFCEVGNIAGKIPRLRSVEHVLGEVELLIENYGIRSLIFDDDNLLINRKRAVDLFKEMIERNYKLKWNSPALAVNKLDNELVGLMKESGCQFVNIAIESGVERVLKDIIHKPVKLNYAEKMVDELKKAGIDVAANFIIGFPGEKWEEIRQTIKYADGLNVDYAKFFIATPGPNTELYRTARNRGYLREGFDFEQHLWSDGWINTPEFNHTDLKILRAYEWDRVNFSKPEKRKKIAEMMGISEERLDEIRKNTLRSVSEKV